MSGCRLGFKRKNSLLLPFGLNIRVPQCSMEDINWVLSGTVRNQMIKMVARAIEAAEWFKGVWYIEENGTLLRPSEHISNGEGIEFIDTILNPIDPQTNASALAVFCKIQKKELSCSDEMSIIVSLGTSQRIMVGVNGFYIWEVRQEYNSDKIILP